MSHASLCLPRDHAGWWALLSLLLLERETSEGDGHSVHSSCSAFSHTVKEKSRMVKQIKSFHTRKISVTDMSSVSGGPTQVEKKHVSSWELTRLQTNELLTAPCFYKSHKWKSWHKHMTSLQICAVKSLVTQWFIVNISRIKRAANSSLGRWDSLSPSQTAGWWPWTPSRSLSHSTQGFC